MALTVKQHRRRLGGGGVHRLSDQIRYVKNKYGHIRKIELVFIKNTFFFIMLKSID